MSPSAAPLFIVADENIPLVREAFGALGRVQCLPGRALTPANVREADILLVRSVTCVDQALLDGSRVRFVGSATIGLDHVDMEYVARRGIAFAHAPGSNADSVVEYVVAALLCLSVRKDIALRGRTVGIVGCGNIGGRLATRLLAFGVHPLLNDPPLAEAAEARGEAHPFVSLPQVLDAADVVTLHVPLVRTGGHPTYHLFDAGVLRSMKRGAWVVNTCRGAVVSNLALRAVLAAGHLGAAVLDVWEHEPTPDPQLLLQVDLATPHIAGYSYDGKVQGTLMLYDALMDRLGREPVLDREVLFAAGEEGEDDHLQLTPAKPGLSETKWLWEVTKQMYDIEADDERMRRLGEMPPEQRGTHFGALRRYYPRRRTFSRHHIDRHATPERYQAAVQEGLGISWSA